MTTKEYLDVFNIYRMYVFYFCKKIINHQEDAEDITHDTFISLWQNKENVLSKTAKAFLIVTANRKCHDYFRVKKHYQKRIITFSLQDFEEVEIDTDVLTYLYKLIETFPPQEKKVLLLKYKDGKEVKEIAKLTKLNPQNISNTLNNGMNRIRNIIKNRGVNR